MIAAVLSFLFKFFFTRGGGSLMGIIAGFTRGLIDGLGDQLRVPRSTIHWGPQETFANDFSRGIDDLVKQYGVRTDTDVGRETARAAN